MAAKKRSRGNPVPLIREEHPSDYTGYPFITLLQYQQDPILTIVDDADDKRIRAYVLDLCGPQSVDEETLINVAIEWFTVNAEKYPLSFELARRGLTAEATQVYRSYNIEFITRVIGPLPAFNMSATPSIKRCRRKTVPTGVQVVERS